MAQRFTVNYCGLTPMKETQVVALWWRRFRLDYEQEASFALADLEDRLKQQEAHAEDAGVYAFIGYHDTVPMPHVLYIGVTEEQPLRARILQNMTPVVMYRQQSKMPLHFREDVWDVMVYWAPAEKAQYKGKNLAELVESLLIASHSPQFNSQRVLRSDIPDAASDLLILNGGNKGMLQPAVSGLTYSYWNLSSP